MASRAAIKDLLRIFLGSTSDDPAFPDATLDQLIQQAADGLVGDIFLQNPDFLVRAPVVLTAASSVSHSYVLANQATPITEFGGVLELRYTDENGLILTEARLDELDGSDLYAVTGPDEAAELVTSLWSTAGAPLWLRYRYWPADMDEDADEPGGIPRKFHDVVALEAAFAFGLGGEQRRPPELSQRWIDRRAALMHHVFQRSTTPRRTRLYAE